MRVLMLHNRYREPGGEDVSYAADAALLEARGHEVIRVEASNEELARMAGPHAFLRAVWSVEAARRVAGLIARHRPHVMHVQNFFAMFSPSVHAAAARRGVPVVQTLRNYRLLCPQARFLRDGRICELCMGRRLAWPAVRYACCGGSRGHSAAVTTMLAVHRMRGTWRRDVARFIALTDFSREKFIEGGFPAERIRVRPNFVDPDPGAGPAERRGIVFVGMLHPWKGAHVLLEAWRAAATDEPLTLIGDGPEEARLRAMAADLPGVRFAGRLERPAVTAALQRARALVFPSIWYETFGRAIVEAFACGTPVIASRLGAAGDLVRDGETGLHFEAGEAEALAAVLRRALADPTALQRMGANARAEYERTYNPDAAYARLMEIYREAGTRMACGTSGAAGWRGT